MIIIIISLYYLTNLEKFENFENSLVTNLQTQINLFKDIFNNVNSTTVKSLKNFELNNIEVNNIKTNTIKVGDKEMIESDFQKIMSIKDVFSVGGNIVKSSKDFIFNTLQIGKQVISGTDLRKLNSLKNIAGYAVDGDGTTHLLFEGGWYELYNGEKFDAWSNDRWDFVYLFRGWKGEFAQHGKGSGSVWREENKNEDVKKIKIGANQVSSYKITWVDY